MNETIRCVHNAENLNTAENNDIWNFKSILNNR